MEWFIGEYERARPIFDRSRRMFHPIDRLEAAEARTDAVELTVVTQGDKRLHARITFPDPEVFRFQWSMGGPPGEHLTEMLVGPPARRPLRLTETEHELTIDAGGTKLVMNRHPWAMRFGAYRTEPADTSLIEPVAEASGWAADRAGDYRAQAYETFALQPGEHLWGLGERFLGPDVRGRRLSHFITEAGGTNTTDRVYKSIPFVVSSERYGLFLHHGEEAVFDLGSTSSASGSILVDAPELDLFVLLGTPKEILRRYSDLTGRPPVPPQWTFGVWLSKCMYESREEVAHELEEAEKRGIKIDVVGLDPWWLLNRTKYDYDFCDFVWNERDFGPLDEFVKWLHEKDVRLCLWVNPNVHEDLEAYVPERLVGQGRVRESCFPTRAFVDFTGPGADWWVEEMRKLLDAGVDAFKLDYGELAPLDAQYADGRTGRQVHNLYGLLASMTAARAGAPFLYTRSGTAGSQRYPTHWPGDAQSSWSGMAGNLRGALAAAWSGLPLWSTDIGGFYARDFHAPPIAPEEESYHPNGLYRPDPELFVRWAQYGLLACYGRFHGMLGREPWLFGDEAVEITKRFIDLRRQLTPYLMQCAAEAAATCCPVMRPVALEFPDDIGARGVDGEYLLGPALLVAPVLRPGGDVDVYLPEGGWQDYFTGERFVGPRWYSPRGLPLDRLPLLVRDGYDPFKQAASRTGVPRHRREP